MRQGFAPLSALDPGLPERVAAFVLTGEGPEVLLALRQGGVELGILLGEPGRLHYRYAGQFHHTREDHPSLGATAGRDAFYQQADPMDAGCVAMLARMGKALEAADQGKSLEHTGASMPDWLQYLLNDALNSSIPIMTKLEEDRREAWTIDLLAAVLKHEGLPLDLALPIVFERRALNVYSSEHVYLRLLAPGALDAFMLTHPQLADAAIAGLSPISRVLFARRLGQSDALRERFAHLLARLAVADSKQVRNAAFPHLMEVARPRSVALLAELLGAGKLEERANAADLLARMNDADAHAVLEQALASEGAKPVREAITLALSRNQAASGAGALALTPPPLPPAGHEILGADAVAALKISLAEMIERTRRAAQAEQAQVAAGQRHDRLAASRHKLFTEITERQLEQTVAALNGDKGAAKILTNYCVRDLVTHGTRLIGRPDFGIRQILRVLLAHDNGYGPSWDDHRMREWFAQRDPALVDLRMVAKALTDLQADDAIIARAALRIGWQDNFRPQLVLPPQCVWPYFAANPLPIDQGLGLAPQVSDQRYYAYDLGRTLEVLATFPVVPARWLPRVIELALGEGKQHRSVAQQIVSKLPDIGARVIEALLGELAERHAQLGPARGGTQRQHGVVDHLRL
ncbi:MAG: HEAT repeat domain-containing protein, partial [Gammaproteobacteria bacterium]